MAIEAGQLMFTKTISTNPTGHGKSFLRYSATKGDQYMVLMLGCLRKQDDTPTKEEFFQLLANAGLMSFDDVFEVFGGDAFGKVKEHLTKKYKTKGDAAQPNEGNENGNRNT